MNDATVISLIAMVGWLIVVSAGFASYRLSWGKTVQLALVWVAIFGGLFLLARLLGLTL
ncbi:MAG: hypothetical protein QNI87_04360 [Erythrobacter sp.]|uniref:hypothetical protein n=1 Tax=Erythrobacter sp. TaxID=1042 RepID=UPI00261E0FC2|nr:hypothetical protein [Erythrobacter sp.]MDJ0977747.1 hypothetical protein [Erythrobacter sp.]